LVIKGVREVKAMDYMKLALELAAKAKGFTSPNPMVGAVIVNNNRIVGQGYHHKAGEPHAEVNALKEAGESAYGADLHVNLEPCSHIGRTPPCTEAIIKAGIKRVYIGTRDPNPKVSGNGVRVLSEHNIEVIEDVHREEALRLNEVFFHFITAGRPFVALKSAMSLDGKIATSTGQSKWITGELAREHGHRLRNKYDAILTGVGTVIQDNPKLTCRLHNENYRDPIRIVLDSRLSIPTESLVITQDSLAPTIICTTGDAASAKFDVLSRSTDIVTVNESSPVDLDKLLEILAKRGITSLLIEGGSKINGSFLTQGLVNKYYLYYAPKIIGGSEASGSFATGFDKLDDAICLNNINTENLGDDLLITGYPRR
jgi:diaminohydroxyphosphoribosylaminopyrimidine deaminase/5-amino-6-(5-phosphoribosylamino)uracil reductase